MSKINYRYEVMRTANPNLPEPMRVLYGAVGLCGEAGEVLELIKKHHFHGKPLDHPKLLKELSDVRWYLEYLCVALDLSMNDVEEASKAKLRARYPNGFTTQAAIERKDENT